MGKVKSKNSVGERIQGKDGRIKAGSDVLDEFTDFYVSVGQNQAKEIPKVPKMKCVQIDKRRSCSFHFVGQKEVIAVIKGRIIKPHVCMAYL